MTTTNTAPGPHYREECKALGLSTYAAYALHGVDDRTPGQQLGSVAIETNLRRLGLVETHDEWNGCVRITDRGRAVRALLDAAGAADGRWEDLNDPSNPHPGDRSMYERAVAAVHTARAAVAQRG